jgi:hypothetical protein
MSAKKTLTVWANCGVKLNSISSNFALYYRCLRLNQSHNWTAKSLALSIICVVGLSKQVSACPVYLYRSDFVPALPSLPREEWRLFTIQGEARQERWVEVPLQVDPMTPTGEFIFSKDQEFKRLMGQRLGENDRMSFRKELFGRRWANRLKMPCATGRIYELRDPEDMDRWGYLAACDGAKSVPQPQFSPPIVFSPKENKVQGPLYAYHYMPSNQLIFTKILLSPDARDLVVSQNSNQAIHADVKNFFNLDFDKDDVESMLLDTRGGNVGLVGRLTFFLRVLFFKIDLQLNTAVSFFRDAVHVPMVINFPVDAFKRLNPGSGILFTWEIDRNAMKLRSDDASLPKLRDDIALAGTKQLADYGRRYCQNGSCRYSLSGEIEGFTWSMNFIIPETLVNYGFFPMYVDDTNQAKRSLKWHESPQDSANRIGFYLQTTGLPKGEHFYDFWINVAESGQPLQSSCPKRVLSNGVIHR